MPGLVDGVRREKRVLIVDDEEPIRALLLTVLRRRGFSVDTARNGSEALDRCASCRYAVVLLDLMMPVMSGHAFLAQLETFPVADRPVVIVLTAGTEPRTLRPDVVAGTIRKPFDIELLVDTLSACLRTLSEREQPSKCPPADSEAAELSSPFDKVS